jgi:hypothetical protein
MPLTTFTRDFMLDQGIPNTVYLQLHTGDPGSNGTNNVSTIGSRQSVSLGAANNGVRASTNNASWTNIDITPQSETLTHFSIWTLVTNGVCLGYNALATNRTVADGDTVTCNAGALTITLT